MTPNKTLLLSKEESEAYLAQFKPTDEHYPVDTTEDVSKDAAISENNRIMLACNDLLLERLENHDSSLRMSDILAAKSEAFKQNQLLKNKSTENVSIIGTVLKQIQDNNT